MGLYISLSRKKLVKLCFVYYIRRFKALPQVEESTQSKIHKPKF